jgi:hypothetical protein
MRIRLTDVRKAFLAYGCFEGCYAYELHPDSNVNRSFNSPSSHTNVGCFEGVTLFSTFMQVFIFSSRKRHHTSH